MREEDKLQIRCKKWLTTALPPSVLWSAIEHAQQLSERQGAIRKAKGVRRGLPDFLFWHAGKSIAVELKTAAGVQSESQKEFMQRFRSAGGVYAVCRSEQDVELVLRAAGVPVVFPAPPPDRVFVVRRGKNSTSKPRAPRPSASKLAAFRRLQGRGLL